MRLPPDLTAKVLELAGEPLPAKRSKYGNRKTTVDGVTFDSAKEARRFLALKAEQAAGRISGLRLQVRFPLRVNDVRVCAWVADFVYLRNGVRVVEDVKSEITRRHPVYRLKKKLVAACLGIEITEV